MSKDNTKNIMTKLYEDAISYNNPRELEDIKKQIKKNIPFGKRLNFAAYLFLIQNKSKSFHREKKDTDITLYLNIGRMGNVHRKALLGFISENSSVDTNEIVNIRMHDRYSFITLDKEKALVLEQDLKGKEFRKRTIVINTAKDNDK